MFNTDSCDYQTLCEMENNYSKGDSYDYENAFSYQLTFDFSEPNEMENPF
jgi:hypothetical protein